MNLHKSVYRCKLTLHACHVARSLPFSLSLSFSVKFLERANSPRIARKREKWVERDCYTFYFES